jgi:DNA-directed RNA polymerase specialized sigma24 family protein
MWGPPESLATLHGALLTGDETARDRLASILLARVSRILIHRMPSIDRSVINDAVEDAVIHYLDHPHSFVPTRSSLETFITFAAWRNVKDLLRASGRRRRAEERAAAENQAGVKSTSNDRRSRPSWLLGVAANDSERRFLSAWLFENASVRELASVLGKEGAPTSEQKVAVRRVKEKLRLRLRRLGTHVASK